MIILFMGGNELEMIRKQTTIIAILISIGAILLASLHTLTSIDIDAIGLALLGISALPWIIPFLKSAKLPGGIELEFKELKRKVEETKHEIDILKEERRKAEEEFLFVCDQFASGLPTKELDKLGTELEALSGSLPGIDFLEENLLIEKLKENQGRTYGTACAIQVRPQSHFFKPLINLINEAAKTTDLAGARLKVIFRIVMAIENILNLDRRKTDPILKAGESNTAKTALEKLANHRRSIDDHNKYPRRSIVTRINRVLKKLE